VVAAVVLGSPEDVREVSERLGMRSTDGLVADFLHVRCEPLPIRRRLPAGAATRDVEEHPHFRGIPVLALRHFFVDGLLHVLGD
jgi:hypothetical protein